MIAAPMESYFQRTNLPTGACAVGLVTAGLFLRIDVLRLIAVAACVGSVIVQASVSHSRVRASKLFLINFILVLLAIGSLRLVAMRIGLPPTQPADWVWLPRLFSAIRLLQIPAIAFGLIMAGLATIEVAGKVGGEVARKRFQGSLIASASVLLVINIVHFLRPACYDCFFPYGLPFTLFTAGGLFGGGGIVWLGLLADAAIIPIFAMIVTLLWSEIARPDTVSR